MDVVAGRDPLLSMPVRDTVELHFTVMTQKIVLFGTGSFSQVAHVYFTKDSQYEVVAFTAHEDHIREPIMSGLPVIPFETLEDRFPPDLHSMFVAVGYRDVNRNRTEIYNACKDKGYELISYISSRAVQWGDIEVGDNCFILEHNVLQPFVKIGNNVVLWSGNHVGHHTTIGDNCFIASHAVISGHVTIGNNCFIGVNATLRDGIRVAPECIIGAGAVILKDTVIRGVYKGVGTEHARVTSDRLRSI